MLIAVNMGTLNKKRGNEYYQLGKNQDDKKCSFLEHLLNLDSYVKKLMFVQLYRLYLTFINAKVNY